MKIGILGSGQLALYLCKAIKETGYESLILARTKDDPACAVADHVEIGELNSYVSLERIFKESFLVTIENEFLDIALIEKAINETGTALYPDSLSIAVAQNKLTQKRLFAECDLPSSIYFQISANEEYLKRESRNHFLKTAQFGYDGKGNCNATKSSDSEIKAFIDRAFNKGIEVYAEEKVDFTKELSLVSSAFLGELKSHYPLLESYQENSVCKHVHLAENDELEERAKYYAEKIADRLNFTGVFAIEFFLTSSNELLINELAPRVHNTGHFTLTSADHNQFDMHINTILNETPITPKIEGSPFMYNLLGPAGSNIKLEKGYLPEPPEHFEMFWYGKTALTPGRKMGHINLSRSATISLDEAKKTAKTFEKKLWESL